MISGVKLYSRSASIAHVMEGLGDALLCGPLLESQNITDILVLKHPPAEGLVIFVESKNPAALWLTELSHNAY